MRSTVFLLIVLQIVNGDLVDKSTLPPLDTTPTDPCSTSHEIASADRVVSSDVTTGRCDDNLNGGWYRFTVNDVPATLPTVCLRPGACGGAVSLRIDLGDQPLPDVGKEVEAWSCGAYDILGKFDCCVLRQPAKIRNCSNFLAYQLQKPDRCDVAYCVEHPRERIPSNVLRKYGEDVSPQSDDTTTPSSSSPATTPDFANSNWCIEGMVWCTRGAPGCMSYEDCLAIPLTTTSSSDITTGTSQATTAPTATTETTPASDVTTEKTTVDSDATTSPNIAEKTTSGNDITTSPNIAGETTLGSDVTTTPNIAEKTTLDSDATTPPYIAEKTTRDSDATTPPNIAEKTTLDSDATTPPNIAEKSTPGRDDTTTPNIAGTTTDSGVTNTEAEETTTPSSPSADTTVLRGLFPFTTALTPNDDSVTTEESTSPGPSPTASVTTSGDYSTTGSTGGMSGYTDNVPRTDTTSTDGDTSSTARTTEAALVQTTGFSSSFSSSSTAAAAGGHVDRSTNQETTSSISSTSAASSSSTMASTASSSSATQSTSPVHSTEGSSSRSPGSSSTESAVFTTEAGSTKATSTSPPGSVDGRIVLEFATDTNVNYTASAKKCMSELLNTYDETGRNIAHTFNAGDVNVMTVDTSSTTTTVVLRVVLDESVGRVVMTARDLINMLKYLQKENRLNTQQCTRNLGKMQDFYRYGEQPTTPPPKSRRSYSLFYDKLPLFIAIIVMVTVCFLILIFGIVYLRFFHHHRKWDRTKDVERAKLKETKEHQGLENPVPDSEMMKDEAVVTETSLTVNGSHPQHSVPLDDDKGWVIPIDQAPETQFEVALKSEDTQL
ncbi:mucin-5AC-like isoform X3 [Haliotis rufescens]|uniref:mucin-5AC-like isoform X3 n=1 Tax=Haliotis rufescens TaxID=6454 RepID=UPI00201E985A|nr:mucin-5AC-like isoform X3 [Haliotis rufescens]